MRALILKEIREGQNVVLFGGLLSALVMALYGLTPVLFLEWQTGADFCNVLLALLPPALGVAAGSVLFAREKATGTLPLLLGLPLSRGRIWWAKVAGGLALTVGATLFFAIPVMIVVPREATGIAVGSYLPEIAAATVLGFALAVLCSTLAERPFSALLVGIVDLVGLVIGAFYVVEGLGGWIFGYSPLSDASLWAMLVVVPALLLGSAAALRHGELLFRGRKWVVGLFTAALVSALLFTLMVGMVRAATRYERSEVTAFGSTEMTFGAPVVALNTLGSRTDLSHTRTAWRSGSPDFHRSSHLVLLSAETGKELLIRRAFRDNYERIAVSHSGRYAAIIAPPEPLTWAAQASDEENRQLSVWDLQRRRLLYRGLPQRAEKGPEWIERSYLRAASWSPDGEWLAVVTDFGTPRFLLVMRPDGSGIRATTIARSQGDPSTKDFAWDPSGKAIYFLDEDLSLVRWSVPEGRKETVWRPGRAPTREAYWMQGAVSVSPDGKRVAVSLLSSSWQMPPAAKQVARQMAVVAADGSGATVVWSEIGSVAEEGVQLTWSAESNWLYFLVPDREHRDSPTSPVPVKVLSWAVGAPAATPVDRLGGLYDPRLAISSKTEGLVVWRRQASFAIVDERNHVRWVDGYRDSTPREVAPTPVGVDAKGRALYVVGANPREVEATFLGVDAKGRAILQEIHYREEPRRSFLSTLDLTTGELKRIYP